jgi:protein TonB
LVDKKGNVLEDFVSAYYEDEIMTSRLKETTAYYFKQLPVFKIKNRKPRPYNSFHRFEYRYLIDYDNNKSLSKIEIPYTYNGGTITEAPLFSGCKRINSWRDPDRFNQKMQEHIGKSFRYPEKAQEIGLQGRINTMFVIQKDGSVGNLRAEGGNNLLKQEAIRIMSLLPKFEPGLRNGDPVRVPLAIPITFKLQ